MTKTVSHDLTLKDAIHFCKESGPEPLLASLQERARELNPKLNAFVRFDGDSQIVKSKDSASLPLAGAPVSIKDNISVDGLRLTCASKILEGYVAPFDAGVIERLKNGGATIFHQCNMDEFAFGSSCETSSFGACRNPWNTDYVPGGSSGGSAASVAAGMTIAALGSDTGGSIRQPAAFCGVVGLKPTYGLVSRYGLVAFGSSFDQIGPITKTVEDSAILLSHIAGPDQRDSTSVPREAGKYTDALTGDVKGLRIGLPKEYFVEGMDPEVEKQVRDSAQILKDMGAEIKEVSLPHTEYSVAVYYIVAIAEASSNLGRFDGVRYGKRVEADDLNDMYFETRSAGFGEEAKRRILLGTFVLSAGYYDAYYRKGQKVRTLIRQDFQNAFGEVDLLLSPTSPTPAFKIGERSQDPLAMYLSDIFTIPANLAGIPAISIPCGFSKNKLPIGLQLMAPHFREDQLFRAAHAFEQKTGIYKERPGV